MLRQKRHRWRLFGSCPWSQSDRRRSPWVSTHGRPSRPTISSRSDDRTIATRSAIHFIRAAAPRLQSSLRDKSFLCHRSAEADGLKPTETIQCRSATDGLSTANSCATVGNAGSGVPIQHDAQASGCSRTTTRLRVVLPVNSSANFRRSESLHGDRLRRHVRSIGPRRLVPRLGEGDAPRRSIQRMGFR